MTTTFICILIATLSVSFIFFYVFRNSNKKDAEMHQDNLTMYKKQLQVHTKQIKKRMTFLNQYDLLKYNVSESLIVQHQIEL